MPVFLLLGIGGLPSDPDSLYFMNDFKTHALNIIQPEHLLEKISDLIPTKGKKERETRPLIELCPNAYTPWTMEDDQLLETLYENGKSINELATLFGRNNEVIKSRLSKLNII